MSTTDGLAPDQDKPAETIDSAPVDGTSADVEQLQRSYDELRSKFNERDQELSQLRGFKESLSDPQRQAEILRDFGIELADEPEEVEAFEEDAFRDPRVDKLMEELQTERQQREAEKAQQQFQEDFDSQVISIEQAEGREMTEKEIKILHDRALLSAVQGSPMTVQDLYKDLSELRDAWQGEYVKSKKTSRPTAGQSASKQPDLETARGREEYMSSRLAALADD